MKKCPYCSKYLMNARAIICIHCGCNVATGEAITTALPSKTPSVPFPPRISSGSSVRKIIAAAKCICAAALLIFIGVYWFNVYNNNKAQETVTASSNSLFSSGIPPALAGNAVETEGKNDETATKTVLIGDQKLADLAIAELSGDTNFEFYERAEIDKILDEHKLYRAGLSSTELMKLFPHAELIAVISPSDITAFNLKNGFLLVKYPHLDKVSEIVEQLKIAREKMRDVKPVLLSIVALRDGGVASASRRQIPALALALERALIASPKIQMLERNYLNSVLDERKLSEEFYRLAPSAKLIRLEFSFGATGAAVDLTLRLSDIQGKILFKETISDCFVDSSNKLKSSVAALQEFLQTSAPGITAENTQAEAKSYFEEHLRLLNLREPRQAEQKLTAALALDPDNFLYQENYLAFRHNKLSSHTSDLWTSVINARQEIRMRDKSDKVAAEAQKTLDGLLKSIGQNNQQQLALCEEALALCRKKAKALPEKQDTFLYLNGFIAGLSSLRYQHDAIYGVSGLEKAETIAPYSPVQQDWLNRALPLYFGEMSRRYSSTRISSNFHSNPYLSGLLFDAEIIADAIIWLVKTQKAYIERHPDQVNPNFNISEYLWLPMDSFGMVDAGVLSKFPQELIDDAKKSNLKILQNYGYIIDILRSVSLHKQDKKLVVEKYKQFLQDIKNGRNFELSNYRFPIRDFIRRLAPEYNRLLCQADAEVFQQVDPKAVSQYEIWKREFERLSEGTDTYAKRVIALAPQMVKAASDEKTRALLDRIQFSTLGSYINNGRPVQKQAFDAVQYDGISVELPFLLRNAEYNTRITVSAADRNMIYFIVRNSKKLLFMQYDVTKNIAPELIHELSINPPWQDMVLKIEGKYMLLANGEELTIINYPAMTTRNVIKNLPPVQALAILNNRIYVIGGDKEIIMLSSDLDGNNRRVEFSSKTEETSLKIEKIGVWRCKVLCADPDNSRLIFDLYANNGTKTQGIYEYLPDKQAANQLVGDTRRAAWGNNILLVGYKKIDLFNPKSNQVEPTGMEFFTQKAETISWNYDFDSAYLYPESLILVKMDCLIKLSKKIRITE